MKFVTLLRSALFFLVLLALSIVHGVPGVANAATKKPAAKAKLSAFTASRFGSLKIRITDKSGKVSTKSIRVGAAKTLSIPAGAKVELVTKPTAGYKAGLIINGELVRFQSDKGKSVKVSARTKKPVFPELVFKLPKGTVSATATAVPLIEARFVPTGAPFAKEAGVVFSGLGSNIRVTNQNPVALSGTAGSDVGVKSVTWVNESTGGGGAAVGKKSWAAAIPFVEGDNKIRVNLIAKDGSTYTNDTVVTYFPAIDFNT
ncbi:MAG: hypothetical protein IT290_12980, partial [Deltaproteobacteria bacterium]|nr:hypothetical protein [Deltaproteobacteria bacterium]